MVMFNQLACILFCVYYCLYVYYYVFTVTCLLLRVLLL